jgi:hypothetical protein
MDKEALIKDMGGAKPQDWPEDFHYEKGLYYCKLSTTNRWRD